MLWASGTMCFTVTTRHCGICPCHPPSNKMCPTSSICPYNSQKRIFRSKDIDPSPQMPLVQDREAASYCEKEKKETSEKNNIKYFVAPCEKAKRIRSE